MKFSDKEFMMNKFAIVTDSIAYLNSSYLEENNVYVAPLSVNFSDGVYKDMFEMDDTAFFAKVAELDEIPKSSQPSPGDIMAVFDEIRAQGYQDVLVISMTRVASGTCAAFELAAQQIDDLDIYVLDSETGLQVEGYYIEEAIKYRDAGHSRDEAVAAIKDLMPSSKLYVAIDDISFVMKGGRLGKAAQALANLLRIKPIVFVGKGKLFMSGRARSFKKAISKMLDTFEEDLKDNMPLRATVSGPAQSTYLRDIKDYFALNHPDVRLEEGRIGPVISVHAGPEAIALMWAKDSSKV